MASNSNLSAAKTAKQDEFYTQLTDIEKELRHYKEYFRDKVVLCNCDDPRVSNFFQYFANNFEHLGLKKLITICYKSQERDLFSTNDSERAIWLEYTGDRNGNRVPDPEEIGIHYLNGDGDFRSKECIELLKQADIVVTNPPFSLFREYMVQLIQYEKKFVILGNINATTYKEIFPLIKENKMWWGITTNGSNRWFQVPNYYKAKENAAGYKEVDGKKYLFVNGIMWFTNLEHKKRHEPLELWKHYTPEEYPKYDNYDAIEVGKTADIPIDYEGVMGVPITFMDKYCPEQFEILGMAENEDLYNLKTRVYTTAECKKAYSDKFGREGTYDLNASGVIIKNGIREKVYQRILIRHKK